MNYVKAGILFFVLWLIQTTLLWRVWPFGAVPNLILCAAVCFAYLYNKNFALIFAVAFGLMLDLQTQSLFGVTALTLVLSCVPAWILRGHFNPERALPGMLSALIATAIYGFSLWGV